MNKKIDVITEINLKFSDILDHIKGVVELDKYDGYILKFGGSEFRFGDRGLLMRTLKKMEDERTKEKEVF